MAAAPAAISLAATGFKVAGDLFGANTQAQGDEYQAQALEDAAQTGQIKANQTSQQLTSKLQSSISRIQAVRASANTDPNSPTGQAIVARTQALGDTRTQIAVGNINAQVAQDESASKFYDAAAKSAVMGGFLSAAGDTMSALGPAFKPGGLFGGGGSPLQFFPA